MGEFIAYLHEAGADGGPGAGRAADGAAGSAPPARHRIAVLVMAPAAAFPAHEARLAAALSAPAVSAGGPDAGRAAAPDGDPEHSPDGDPEDSPEHSPDGKSQHGPDGGGPAEAPAGGGFGPDRFGWLAEAGIRCHAIVVDREDVAADAGALRGRTVAQVVHGAVSEAIAVAGHETEVRTDAAAVAALSAGFARHAAARYEADLFRPLPVVRAADPEAAPTRLAGLLVRRIAQGLRDGTADPALQALLRAGWLTLEEWPPARDRNAPARSPLEATADAAVRTAAVEAAWRFVADTPAPRDEDGRVQRIVLTHLLFTALHGDGGYVSSAELLQLLAARGYENLQEHYLQSAIVAGLRDSGVPVTSSSRGYKIPQARQDLLDFVNLVDGQVIPLLERLARVRQALGAAGGGAWDLDDPRHAKLRRLMDALENRNAPGGGAAPDGRP